MRLPEDRILHIDTEVKNGKVNIVVEWQGELVRCKDCKHAYKRKPINKTAILCELFGAGMKDNDFCSYGERSEE